MTFGVIGQLTTIIRSGSGFKMSGETAKTDIPEGTYYPPKKHPELWEECQKCGGMKKAPRDYTGDICICEEDEEK